MSFRIAFELRPLADIAAWGSAETGLKLHWFGLTDGWYDVIIDDRRLFSVVGETRGIDYQVVRLWEDLINVAKYALEPLPDPIAARVADLEAWTSWVAKICDLDDHHDVVSTALSWWWDREMSASHLVGAPSIQMWCIGDELQLRWKSLVREGDPLWSSPSGHSVMKAEAFRDELLRFDRELIAAMAERVREIERSWSRSEISIDVDDLRREHGGRARWLQESFAAPRYRAPTWDEIEAALVTLESHGGE